MNLQLHLLTRIAAAAMACLLAAAGLSLYRSDRQARLATEHAAETLVRQLERQLLKAGTGIGTADAFPDFEAWQNNPTGSGACIAYAPADASEPRRLCNLATPQTGKVPSGFETIYRLFLTPGVSVARPVVYHRRQYGLLSVIPSVEWELAEAWSKLRSLMELSAATVLAVCLLVYLSISSALRPAGIIVAGLERMRRGNLDYRLPAFSLNEWRYIAEAVNQLAASHQRLLSERQALAVKLMGLQEEERRYLARELHDEFGQCLTAINALALSMTQGADRQCPELSGEAQQIRTYTQHMLDNIRNLLRRLRPAELDELGLAASLDSLIAGWRQRSRGTTDYRLSLTGDCTALPEPLAIALFRVIQECLTNVAKHAEATHVRVELSVSATEASLRVTDDGSATEIPASYGIGLLGMRERIAALHGTMKLAIASPHGLIVEACLPLEPVAGVNP
ncbi:sensor histidine kinase [Methylococcus sp. EFPC2]|uniref:sensor histidine kinase n=1 Tax=Methylococcus sp. EFPC2 TaxID=2812648 RepID=UPI00196800CD|nr:sensor histidine kinase [Methylococcus sp. EFPC2]QSA98509.1 sensor histidine kinase [Methylococcus sp. EFPC2]